MGFAGSYEIVKRRVRQIKDNYDKVACMHFETELGYQAQVDFGEFQVARADGSVTKLFLFSMILGYSRKVYVELIEYCDLPRFLDWQDAFPEGSTLMTGTMEPFDDRPNGATLGSC